MEQKDWVHPPRLYNQILRKIAAEKGNTIEENAQLFALVNVAMGDAGILAWDQKYVHNFWRPIIGIREHDKSMGPIGMGNNNIDNDCDPMWLPLGAPKTNEKGQNDFTPPFPAYPSGHATFGAAAFHMIRLFYGTPVGNRAADTLLKDSGGNLLDFISDEFNGSNSDSNGTIRPKHTRNFSKGLWRMIEENGLSRVYLGVHWSFDAFELDINNKPKIITNTANPNAVGIGGAPLGVVIAEDIFTNGLKLSSVPPR
jgi:vanadium chloroperoxidase